MKTLNIKHLIIAFLFGVAVQVAAVMIATAIQNRNKNQKTCEENV